MAKIVKRRKRKMKLQGVAIVMLFFALFCQLASCLLVNTVNAALTMKIQKMNEEVEALRSANQTLSYEIQSLENKDRVFEVAQAADLEQLSENIISISGE